MNIFFDTATKLSQKLGKLYYKAYYQNVTPNYYFVPNRHGSNSTNIQVDDSRVNELTQKQSENK